MIELKKQSAAISVEAKDTDINFNKPTLKGDKGDKGDNGLDGYSPIVTLTPEEDGTTITVTDKQGTKEAFIANGKDAEGGAGGIVIKSMYVANDFAEGVVASGNCAFDYDFITYKELPDKANIVDIGIWYSEDENEPMEYRGFDLYQNELLGYGNAYISIFSTATDNVTWGGKSVAKGYDEENGKLLTSVNNYLGYIKGFTIYYFEYIEGDTNENA